MPKAIVFDLLTALLDSWTLWTSATNDPETALTWRKEYLRLTFSCGVYKPYSELVHASARNVGLPSSAADTLLSTWDSIRPWPETRAVLVRLKELGYRVGVVSNCSRELGHRAAGKCGVEFDAVVTAEEAGFYKPAPEAYGAVLREMGVEAEEVVFAAGSNGDVVGAGEVGMDVVWHNRIGLEGLPGRGASIEGRELGVVLEYLGEA
ncbi:HAD-like domain-containing protein [Aspergillus avenaceus]|uniref:HAD-like domain-containing protein n=1 Tax=Aspergillus avenaceus TaxID=36643 RepID=A0A5N6U460_ASPAV|nr:HAD-like domain-containing protein [Aspergillus avenaceus]